MKTPKKHRSKWTNEDASKLRELARKNVSTKEISRRLGRTEAATRAKASELHVTLKPKDR